MPAPRRCRDDDVPGAASGVEHLHGGRPDDDVAHPIARRGQGLAAASSRRRTEQRRSPASGVPWWHRRLGWRCAAWTSCPMTEPAAPLPLVRLPDGTVKQVSPLTGTVVWTVPGRAHRPLSVPLSLIHISEPTRLGMISYAVFCLKK